MKEKYCQCGRKILVKVKGRYKGASDGDHDLCFKCYNSHRNKERARRLAEEMENGKEERKNRETTS